MNIAKPIKGIQVKEHEMNFVRQIRGVEVSDIVTKYYFRGDVLCFQILMKVNGGETISYREFMDYTGYKDALKDLQKARDNDTVIKIPVNSKQSSPAS